MAHLLSNTKGFIIATLLLLVGCGELEPLGTMANPAFEQNFTWEPYVSEEGGFTVEFPVAPMIESKTAPNGGKYQSLSVFSASSEGAGGGLFRITYTDSSPGELDGYTAGDIYDMVQNNLVESAQDTEVRYLEANLGDYEIRRIWVGDEQEVRLILVSNRLFNLSAGVDQNAARFLDSFQPN